MIWSNALKYPMLTIGIIMFTLFLTADTTQGWWSRFRARYIPNTCSSIIDRSQKDLPSDWKMSCPGTELLIIDIEDSSVPQNMKDLRMIEYRQLANAYVTLANKTNIETLEMLQHIHITMKHSKLEIYSESTGKHVSKFYQVRDKTIIAKLLKQGVKVRETTK